MKFAKVMFLHVSVCPHRGRGHAWFYLGVCAWFYSGGVCGFIWGGMRGFILGGVHGFIWGACVVFSGGMHGFSGGVHVFFSIFRYNEIQSMSGRYASYWNAFLLPPANEVCEGYVFTGVCHSVHRGHAWLLWGGMHGCSRGGMCGCSGGGVHAWFFR